MKGKMLPVVLLILASVSGTFGQCNDVLASCPGWKTSCGSPIISQLYCRKTCGTCSPPAPSWTQWSSCDVTCGLGSQTRTRGSDTESRTCDEGPCPGSGVWGSWGQFGPCDKQCGGGTRTRIRTCNPPGQCIGSGTDSEPCNQNPCPECKDKDSFCQFYKGFCDTNLYVQNNCKNTCNLCEDPVPTNPEWNTWGAYSACTKQCGVGTQTRTRTCNIPNQCSGSSSETINCNTQSCPVPQWSNWSNFGPCSKTCGGGQRTRTRTCSISGQCSGQSEESTSCNEQTCPVPQWSNWSNFGQCSRTCGGGQKKRDRTCSVPGQCSGDSEESMPCNEQFCPVPCTNSRGDWYCTFLSAWCGNFDVKNGCRKTCNACPKPPGVWNNWSNWGQCSKTCGGGQSTRTRTCQSGDCSGDSTESRSCNEQDCPPVPSWTNWGSWSQCDKECGGGQETRTRVCTVTNACPGPSIATRSCNEQSCEVVGDWTSWGQWSECTELCGVGQQTRNRQCFSSLGCGVDSSSETRNCNTQPCIGDWASWGQWSECTELCGVGQQTRTRQCFSSSGCGVGSSSETRNCNTQPCIGIWASWGQWSDCSELCGVGQQTRTRQCLSSFGCEVGSSSETRNCNTQNCPTVGEWTSWGQWNDCSELCGGGQRTRSRQCFSSLGCGAGSATETVPCNTQPCATIGNWQNWFSWGGCSVTCGGGVQQRTRVCDTSGCVGVSSESRSCEEQACPGNWQNWLPWGGCSVTCGGGVQQRTRVCDTSGCVGVSSESRSCEEQACPGNWQNWLPWGGCSVTCGGGVQQRTRVCDTSGCVGVSSESQSCEEQTCPGNWQNWLPWGGCTVTCGGGVQERTRVCGTSGCVGVSSEDRTCQEQPCPVSWTNWTEWGTCSKTCGGGESVRTRQCMPININCPGSETEKQNCNEFLCILQWEAWGTWGACSKTCGLGQRIRSRSCPIVNRCLGSRIEEDVCNDQTCPVTTSWSACSKSCGYGTQFKTESGFTTYQSCNTHNCVQSSCIGKSRRKAAPWSCCSVSGETCGQSVVGGRIIGGQTSDAKEWPFMASLTMKSSATATYYSHICGGVVIARQWILTSGHCLVSSTTRTPFDITLMRVYAGFVSMSQRDSQASYADIEEAIPHPSLSFPEHDIGLIKLKTMLPDNEFIKPVCLPGGEVTPQDTKCFIMGWGTTISQSSTISPNLMDAEVYNFNMGVCRSVYTSSGNFATFVRSSSNILCAGTFTEGVDSCRGDSGGPLLCQRCDSCNMYVAGIVSFGPWPCAKTNIPGIYTKVLAYQNWIQTETRLRPTPSSCSTFVGP